MGAGMGGAGSSSTWVQRVVLQALGTAGRQVLALTVPAALPCRHTPPSPPATALHHPAPGHALPGHLLRATALLL